MHYRLKVNAAFLALRIAFLRRSRAPKAIRVLVRAPRDGSLIRAIRGVWEITPSPSAPFDPRPPLPRDDLDHVRQARRAMPAALDDDEQPVASRQPDCVAREGDADASPRGNLSERERARSPCPYFVRYDSQCRELADREASGQGRGQGAGEGQPAAPRPRGGPIRRDAAPPALREHGDGRQGDSWRADLDGVERPYAPPGGFHGRPDALGVAFVNVASPVGHPKSAGELVNARERAGTLQCYRDFVDMLPPSS